MGKTTHQVVGETTQGRRANDSGDETTQGETTQGERENGRNDPLPLLQYPIAILDISIFLDYENTGAGGTWKLLSTYTHTVPGQA